MIGEALIDLVPIGNPHEYRARAGGSPFNVAVGLARLGNNTRLMARLANNALGRILREHAEAEGIDLTHAARALEPTSVAIVSLDDEGKASYDFYREGTADWQWTPAELAPLGADASLLHFGSLASWTRPGSEHIHAAVSELHARGQTLISYDPNVRPLLMGDPASSRSAIEASVRCSHVAKASRDDLEWLYPDADLEHIAAHWLELGAQLVVVTDGADGAHAYRKAAAPIHRPGRRVEVVDTVGAGDAFTAGLLNGLARRGRVRPELVHEISADILVDAIDEAILVSSLTCERVGADPPSLTAGTDAPATAKLSRADLRFKP